jgi:hypothetical protein
MVTEPDEAADEWPTEADSLNASALPVIEAIFAASYEGSSERSAAMNELMSALASKATANVKPTTAIMVTPDLIPRRENCETGTLCSSKRSTAFKELVVPTLPCPGGSSSGACTASDPWQRKSE